MTWPKSFGSIWYQLKLHKKLFIETININEQTITEYGGPISESVFMTHLKLCKENLPSLLNSTNNCTAEPNLTMSDNHYTSCFLSHRLTKIGKIINCDEYNLTIIDVCMSDIENKTLYHAFSSFLLSSAVQYLMIPREEVELYDVTSYNIFDNKISS